MTIEQIVIYAIDKFSQPGSSSPDFVSGFFLIASAALWTKKYLINGNLKKYFDLREKEIENGFALSTGLKDVRARLDTLVEEQERFFDSFRGAGRK